MRRLLFVVLAIAFGAFAGAFCWAFFFLMNLGIDLLWNKAPAFLGQLGLPAVFYPILFCALGGLAIGLFQKRVGAYPDDMNTVLAEVKKTGRYEYKHIKAMFVGALLPLLFGGSIGPEAGLTGVIAGLCTWVGDRLKFVGSEMRELASAGTAAIISTIFAAPLFGLAAPLFGYADESDGKAHADDAPRLEVPKPLKVVVYILSIAGALGAFMLLGSLVGSGGGLPHFSQMSVSAHELMWMIPLMVVGICAGWLFHAFGAAVHWASARLGQRPVLKALIAGLVLGGIGVFLPFTMFAGEAQTEMLAAQWTGMSALVLLATGFLKVLSTQVCLGLGWRGGHFFPIIFAGISIGYACAGLMGVDPVFALCVCTAALLGVVMRQPLMVALLLILCFPVKGVVFMLIAACIGSVIPVPKRFGESA
ncbi:MAG: chloride channel protein [Coriobacteriales bacterium]